MTIKRPKHKKPLTYKERLVIGYLKGDFEYDDIKRQVPPEDLERIRKRLEDV